MNVNIHSDVPEGYYGKLASAWLKNDTDLKDLYPIDEKDINQIQDHYAYFDTHKREWLANILSKQYEGIELHSSVTANIEKIRSTNTFTVTTGQQIHIFLGPAFFVYTPQQGPTGRLSTNGLEPICDALIEMGEKENSSSDIKDIFKLFKEAYTRFSTLSAATRFILNALFGKYGLIIIDADSASLKSDIKTLIHEDLFSDSVYEILQSASVSLKSLGYGNQVNPRKTHFFLLKEGERFRIDREVDGFLLHPSGELVSSEKMLQWATEKPPMFSPNALLRPLYQQQILPNIAYVCGPAEMHYWHQLFPLFKQRSIVAPILFLRDSYLVMDVKTQSFLVKYNMDESVMWKGFVDSSRYLEEILIGENTISRELEELKNKMNNIFRTLFDLKYKNIKELRSKSEVWIKELEKAEKSASNDIRMQPAFEPVFGRLQKISMLYFDKNKPQERMISWVELLLKTGNNLYDLIIESPQSAHAFGTLCV
ncbi:MAG: bacillithiol biosynthesis BshC [Bacteroidetes bacterium]|nr:bacillithiol biosynthesis BshC [Bacteroidota bacterium]